MSDSKLSRRIFLMGSTVALAGCATPRIKSLRRLGYQSPNEKLNIASIAAGGKATSDIESCRSENIVALADPDARQAAKIFAEFPDAKQYQDFRVMLEKEDKNIDAVIVATPDHVHAIAAITAMKMGKHVYVQKPMAHTVYEARKMAEIAREHGVASQMGNQGHSGEGTRRCCEMVWSGAIGPVREVHAWTNRPIWPQGIPEPLPEEPVPDNVDWDVWIGPSPFRPYNSGYAPFRWRGWYEFGTGALGDMACHILDCSNFALCLDAPISVECIHKEGANTQTFPNKSIVKYEFAARGSMPPVTLYWYDGGLLPKRPEGIPADEQLGDGDNGSLFIGDNGYITVNTYGDNPRLVPNAKMEGYRRPQPIIPRSTGHYTDWIQACKGGPLPCSNFDYAGPFTEWVVLGAIAPRVEGKLLWDSKKLRFTNNSEANKYVQMKYRKGWSL